MTDGAINDTHFLLNDQSNSRKI